MKYISFLKAIGSGLIWGLGQLLNKQYLKALFFFVIFVSFISIEVFTSNYGVTYDKPNQVALDKITGNDFADSWYQNVFQGFYNSPVVSNYEAWDEYVAEIGVENINDLTFITFFAQDLLENSYPRYTSLATNTHQRAEDFNLPDGAVPLQTTGTLWFNSETQTFYREVTVTDSDGRNSIQYLQTNHLSLGSGDDLERLTSNEGLVLFVKSGQIYHTSDNKFWLRVTQDGVQRYLLLDSHTLQINNANDFTTSPVHQTQLLGPIYHLEDGLYEYYQAGLNVSEGRLQYKPTAFSVIFRRAMLQTYQNSQNRHTSNDFKKLMLRVYFELNPDIRDTFYEQYEHFFYDTAGMFVKGYWSVLSLGEARNMEFYAHHSLINAMIGTSSDQYNLRTYVTNEDSSIILMGHVSTQVLLEGLISVILSMFFLSFGFWSIYDAFKTSEGMRRDKGTLKARLSDPNAEETVNRHIEVHHLKGVAYFKHIWQTKFEYIVLSPALFVLAFISIMPIAFGFVIAFTSIRGAQSMISNFDWVGFQNFIAVFDFNSALGASFGVAFWRVLGWTIIWAILSTVTVFFGGFFQALILNSESVVFRKLWRTILILPWAIPALLSQMVFAVMFNEFGLVNQIFQSIGLYDIFQSWGILGVPYSEVSGILRWFWLGNSNIQWFTNPFNANFVRATLVLVNIWLGFPYFMALMTGIMTAIDKSLYEAADIDGASGFQKLMHITMPLVLYSTAPILIMTFSGNFNNFGVIYFITQGGPNAGSASRGFAGDTDILISWMYKLTTDSTIAAYNMASVFSILIFLFVGSLTAWNLSRTRAFQED